MWREENKEPRECVLGEGSIRGLYAREFQDENVEGI